MKKVFLFFYFSLFTLSLFGQNYSSVTQRMVKREVKNFVQLFEKKVSKKIAPFNNKGIIAIRDTFDVKTSLGSGIKLIYYKNGKKDLYIDNFIDIGADGWDKNNSYDGVYSNNILFEGKFINWDKTDREFYLRKYSERIKSWCPMLKRVKK